MAAAAMKHMASNFSKLDKFEGVDFRRWQKKMHFLLSSMSVVFVLTTPIPEDGGDDATVEQIRKKAKWDNDDYAKYMAEDASSKKFLVSNFTNYNMTDSRPVMEQYNELLGILGRFTQHKMNMNEAIQGAGDKPKGNNIDGPSVVNMIEHNNSSKYNDNKGKRKHHDNTRADPNKKAKATCWKCGKTGHIKKDCKGVNVGNKANGSGTKGSVDDDVAWLNIINDNIVSAFMSTSKLNDSILWHARLGHVYFKRMQDMSKDGLIPAFDTDTEKCKTCMLTKITKKPFQNVKRETEILELIHSDLCDLHATPSLGNKIYVVTFTDDASSDPKLKTMGERGIECIFVGYAEHSKAFRFFVIEPNESFSINSITEGTRDEVSDQYSYCFNVEDDPKTFDKAMKSQDVALWKEAINNEMDSIMGNNTWVLADLPPGCKPLGCKWIFKRKLKVDGTIEKFKARLVIQGFKQKSGIYDFDTYAPVARISIIRLLIVMASIYNLIIHQLDVKSTFLNGELDEEVYMNQPQGFIMSGNENKMCKLIKSLYGLKQAPKFSMKDMGEADVILSIKIKHKSNGIAISQSHYIEKVPKKFNYFDCTLVSTPMDTSEKLMPNNGQAASQLEYSKVIGCLMYAMTCTRPDIAFAVGKLSMYTSNPGTQHWKAIQRVLKYLKKTMDYKLTYNSYPSVLEGYTDASWISNSEDNSSISGWVFLLGGGAICWASKKQTCITGSTMEYEFVALAVAGKEAEWLRNLILEIPLWSKPITPIFIRCDGAATLAKAYSQMYNGKSRHLGVRHSMIHELITNGVISIEFVRSQQNLADHLTKGLARDLVIKSAEGMRLKMCLEPAKKEDEVVNFLMVNFFEKEMAEEDALLAIKHECVYVLTTLIPEDGGDNPTVKQVRKRAK
ncbi:zinc finger, CCHC-type containing protein [Tanacetum coccineum]